MSFAWTILVHVVSALTIVFIIAAVVDVYILPTSSSSGGFGGYGPPF